MLFFQDVVQERGLASTCLMVVFQPKKTRNWQEETAKLQALLTWHTGDGSEILRPTTWDV